jgi:RND superfamily putative drug exporter
MTLLGKHAWWMPKRMTRFVPNLDIEGENLAKGTT